MATESTASEQTFFVPSHAKFYAKKNETAVSGVYLSNRKPAKATVIAKKVKGKIDYKISAFVEPDKDDKNPRLYNFVEMTDSDWNITMQFLVQEGILENALDYLV